MSRTVVDLDDDALAIAATELCTKTKVDTVNAASREVANRRLRMAFLEDAASGSFDHLAEPGARERAGR